MWQTLLILCPTQWSEHFPKTCSARRVWRHCSSSHSPQVMWSTGELTAKVKSCGGWLYVVSMSSLWEEAMGCSVPDTDGSSWSQLAPTDPLQDTAEPISQAGGISRKTHFKKEQNHCILVWGEREKSRRKDPVNSRGQRRSCWSGRAGLTHLSHGQLPATHLAVHSFSLLDRLRGGNRKGRDKDWNQLCLAWGNPGFSSERPPCSPRCQHLGTDNQCKSSKNTIYRSCDESSHGGLWRTFCWESTELGKAGTRISLSTPELFLVSTQY